ncbi:MAG: SRPBCC domain-containing protein [Dehalococcoidia bacterium]
MANEGAQTVTDRTKVEQISDRELALERVFDAPRELVFKAWTEPERLLQWWGPRSYPTVVCTVDLRPGGVWHYCMRSAEGDEAWGRAEYREIVPPERLVYVDAFSDAEGSVIPPETVITLTFEEQDGKTLMKSHSLYASAEEMQQVIGMGMVEGISETFDRLDEYLAQG